MTSHVPARAQATGRQIASGAAWLMLFKLVDRSIGLVSTLILARLLVPADFGLVAMATAVVAFTQLMSSFGFDSALIQRQDARREHYDTAWSFNVLFGAGMAIALCLLAWPTARFYSDERLAPILLVLAGAALLGGLENIGTVAFRKELDFRSEFRFLFAKRIVAFAVTVAMAFAFRSYWALVVGTVTGRVASVWISYRLHPFRPRFSLRARADLMHFSKWIFLSSLIQFFHARSTDFILGRTVGSHGLGIYNLASEIATMPSSELIAPLNRAVYPAYARLNNDHDGLRERFLEVFGVICLIGVPVCAALFCVADPAVRLVLGANWLEAIPLIQVFALSGLLSALSSNLYLVVVAMGRPQANTFLSGSVLIVALPTVVWASLNHGIQGAALAQLGSAALAFVGIVAVFSRTTSVAIRDLCSAVWRPLVGSIMMMGVLLALDRSLLQQHPILNLPIVRLAALGLAAGLSYPLLTWVLWKIARSPRGAETMLAGLARGWILRRRSSQQATTGESDV